MRIVGAHLAEFLEDPCLIFWCDPNPGVTDRDLRAIVCLVGRDADPSALWGELHCVGKKIEKDLFDLPLVADEVPKPLVNCNIEIDTMLCGSLAYKGASVVYCQGKIER